ncbi:hypothetical protein BJF89_17185 [Corynebacterium sp. CNJ-954]|nr:hypothetical protein BJF89_17185 [Corynebacterium sp. CNJ-954]
MRSWRSATAHLAWATVIPVADLGGGCSAWGFTNGASPLVRAGFVEGEAVPMLAGDGAQVSIVVSEGDLPKQERKDIQAEVGMQRAEGIAVYWIQSGPVPGGLVGPGRGADAVTQMGREL